MATLKAFLDVYKESVEESDKYAASKELNERRID